MTNDFKTKMLDWLVGNYNTESGLDYPKFSNVTSRQNNFKTKFDSQFPYGYFIRGTLQGQDTKNNGVGFTVIYGIYYTDSSTTTLKGFITIMDEDFDIIQNITQYSSGTNIGMLEILEVGDDGNFYGVESVDGTKRFIMLNNIIAKLPTEQNYKAVLRQSYNLQGQSLNITNFSKIIKSPGQSKYLLVGNDSNDYVIATELTINVGSTNNWVDYTYTGAEITIGDAFTSWDSQGNLIFKLAGFKKTDSTNLQYAELTGNSESGQTMTLNTYGNIYNNTLSYSVIIENFNSVYFSIVTYTGNMLYLIHFNNGNIKIIHESYTYYINQALIQLQKNENEIFVLWNQELICRIALIINDNIYFKNIYEDITYDPMFTITKQFNLHNFFIQDQNTVYNVKLIFNLLNYNGNPYQALNSMVSNSAILYDSDGVEIFARNLYNRVVNNNTTTSTIEVPNNFINNIIIKNKELISQTNNILNTASTEVVTNIYEELLINFINTLIMQNRNNPDNIISNIVGASRINNSISNPLVLDYSNAQASKFKINYTDNTSVTQNIAWTKITNYYQAKMFIYVPKAIKNIEIISADGNTVYQTITDNYTVGNFYIINQDVWILEKQIADNVLFDTEQVYFGTDEVYY